MKTFLLGVGAQKAGTTWLHDYLNAHPNIDMGMMKEFHCFNQLALQGGTLKPSSLVKSLWMRLYRSLPRSFVSKQKSARYGFVLAPETYFSYFGDLAARGPDVQVVGDITPAYAGLSQAMLEHIKQSLQGQGLQVRVVFIMRDPVERVISAVRMRRRNRVQRLLGLNAGAERDELMRGYRRKECEERTRYEITIEQLEKTFGPENVLYLFYEELFTEASMARLAGFLGVSLTGADFSKQINVSRNDTVIGDTDRAVIFDYYRSTYAFIAERFGPQRIAALWPNYRYYSRQ
jgi:hypothetical protein